MGSGPVGFLQPQRFRWFWFLCGRQIKSFTGSFEDFQNPAKVSEGSESDGESNRKVRVSDWVLQNLWPCTCGGWRSGSWSSQCRLRHEEPPRSQSPRRSPPSENTETSGLWPPSRTRVGPARVLRVPGLWPRLTLELRDPLRETAFSFWADMFYW